MRKEGFSISICIGLFLFSPGYAQPGESDHPLSLPSAIQMAIDNNPEIKVAAGKVKASKGRFWNGVSPAAPELSVTNDDIPTGQSLTNYGVQTIGISQSMEFPTAYFLRGAKYAKERRIAENESALMTLGVISQVKKSYSTVLASQKLLEIAQGNLVIAQDFVKKAEVHHSVGEGSNLERLTAKVTYTEALNNLETRKNLLRTAFAELNHALGNGKAGSKTFLLTDTLTAHPFPFTLDQLADDAAAAHPQLQINRLLLDVYSAERILAWSRLLPDFNLAYFGKNTRNAPQTSYGASLTIGVPLWFMFDQKGRIQEASANVSVAESELQMAGNSVNVKIQVAFAEFKYEEKQVQLYVNDILPQTEEIFRTAVKSFEAGEITYIEYLQAQQTLINARGGYANALLSYNLSVVAIEEVVGKTLQ